MHCINAMFSKGKGGIEQAFLDYNEALVRRGFKITSLVHPQNSVRQKIRNNFLQINNFSQFDPFAIYRLYKIIEDVQPEFIIAHGNRAFNLLYNARRLYSLRNNNIVPIIALSHNYSLSSIKKADYIFAITNHLRNEVIYNKYPENRIFVIPNMVNTLGVGVKRKTERKVPVIGAMARFVEKKGIETFIKALSLLQVPEFKAIIAGDGPLRHKLEQQIKELNLKDKVEIIGWVEDKALFFQNIDIFCVPSYHEPFGIVILESFLHSIPVIATNSEGPSEIIHNYSNGILVDIKSAEQFATAIEELLSNSDLYNKIMNNARKDIDTQYSLGAVSDKISDTIHTILG